MLQSPRNLEIIDSLVNSSIVQGSRRFGDNNLFEFGAEGGLLDFDMLFKGNFVVDEPEGGDDEYGTMLTAVLH